MIIFPQFQIEMPTANPGGIFSRLFDDLGLNMWGPSALRWWLQGRKWVRPPERKGEGGQGQGPREQQHFRGRTKRRTKEHRKRQVREMVGDQRRRESWKQRDEAISRRQWSAESNPKERSSEVKPGEAAALSNWEFIYREIEGWGMLFCFLYVFRDLNASRGMNQ